MNETNSYEYLRSKRQRIAFYLRVSSQEQKNSRNIQRQIDTALDFINSETFKERYELVRPPRPIPGYEDFFFIDDGYNAEEIDVGSVLDDLIKTVQQNLVDVVYVDSIDRLLRSEKDEVRGKISDRLFLRRDGFSVFVRDMSMHIQEGLMLTMLGKMSARQKAAFLRNGHLGKKSKTKNENRPASGHTLYGYCLEKNPTNKFVIVEDEAQVVRWVVKVNKGETTDDMPEELKTLVALNPKGAHDKHVIKILHDLGYNQKNHLARNKYGQCRIDKGVCKSKKKSRCCQKKEDEKAMFPQSWISNLFKRGYYNGTRISKFMPTEKIRMKAEANEYEEIISTVPPIVSEEDWNAAKANRSFRYVAMGRHEKQQYLLNEVMYCSHCGLKMSARPKHKKHKSGNGTTVTKYYTCKSKSVEWRDCPGRKRCHNANNLDPLVKIEVKNFLNDPEKLTHFVPNDRPELNQKMLRLSAEEERVRDQIQKIKEEELRIFRISSSAVGFSPDIIEGEIKRIRSEQVTLNRQLQKYKQDKIKLKKILDEEDQIDLVDIKRRFGANFDQLSFDELKNLIRIVTKKITITSDGKVAIYFKSVI